MRTCAPPDKVHSRDRDWPRLEIFREKSAVTCQARIRCHFADWRAHVPRISATLRAGTAVPPP